MPTDDFLQTLRTDWRSPAIDVDRMRRLTERRQRLANWSRALNLVGVGVALLFGGWFAYRAATGGDPVLVVGAAAFFVALPIILIEYAETRRILRVRYDDTPRGVLLQARQHVDWLRRMLRGCRWSAMILAVSAVAVLLLIAGGLTDLRASPFISVVWATTAALAWLWQAWRARRLAGEAEACESLLAELSDAERTA